MVSLWKYIGMEASRYVSMLEIAAKDPCKEDIFRRMYNRENFDDTITCIDGYRLSGNASDQECDIATEIINEIDYVYCHELMKMEIIAIGEIGNDIVSKTLNAAANKYITALNEGKECNFDICEEATRALLYLEDLGVITRKEYMDAGHILYEMDMEFCETFKWS